MMPSSFLKVQLHERCIESHIHVVSSLLVVILLISFIHRLVPNICIFGTQEQNTTV